MALQRASSPAIFGRMSDLWSGIEMVVYGTSIRFLQSLGWRQIDILAEEVVRRSPSWRCSGLLPTLGFFCYPDSMKRRLPTNPEEWLGLSASPFSEAF